MKRSTGNLTRPRGIAVNPVNGEIAIADVVNDRILLYNARHEFLSEFGKTGRASGYLHKPFGVAYTLDGRLVVTEEMNHRVQLFDSKTGEFLRSFGKKGNGDKEFNFPTAVSVANDGRIIVCDGAINRRVKVLDSNIDRILLQFPVQREYSDPLLSSCIFHHDRFFLTDSKNRCIKVYDNTGVLINTFENIFQEPQGLCVYSSSNLIVCDRGKEENIKMITLDGQLVGRSLQPIPDSDQVAKCLNDTIVVTRPDKGSLSFLR